MNTPISFEPKEAAARLNVPLAVVRELIKKGRLFAVKFNRKTIRIPLWTIEEFEKMEGLFRSPAKSIQ